MELKISKARLYRGNSADTYGLTLAEKCQRALTTGDRVDRPVIRFSGHGEDRGSTADIDVSALHGIVNRFWSVGDNMLNDAGKECLKACMDLLTWIETGANK